MTKKPKIVQGRPWKVHRDFSENGFERGAIVQADNDPRNELGLVIVEVYKSYSRNKKLGEKIAAVLNESK